MRTAAPALLLAAALFLSSCNKGGRETGREDLPFPPAAETGVQEGEFLLVEYGLRLPLPEKWKVQHVSETDSEDVLRASSPDGKTILQVKIRPLGAAAKPDLETELRNEYKGLEWSWERKGARKWNAAGGEADVSFWRVKEPGGLEWDAAEVTLPRKDFWVWIRARRRAGPEARPLAEVLEPWKKALEKASWFWPVGPRGISRERYELEVFGNAFVEALRKGNPEAVEGFFGDLYPERPEWRKWYKNFVETAGKESFEVERAGLVIDGKEAVLDLEFRRPGGKEGVEPVRERKAFRLSKREGPWKIVEPYEKQ